jgi:hypothetical protein
MKEEEMMSRTCHGHAKEISQQKRDAVILMKIWSRKNKKVSEARKRPLRQDVMECIQRSNTFSQMRQALLRNRP